jgi:hypothetical protein
MQWHLARCFDRQLQNILIQKWPLQTGIFPVEKTVTVEQQFAGESGLGVLPLEYIPVTKDTLKHLMVIVQRDTLSSNRYVR